jgi:heme/copper-type cytochrome/quinol oxidase subunit 3
MAYGKLAIGSFTVLLVLSVVVAGATYLVTSDMHRAQISFVFCGLAFGLAFFGMQLYEKAFRQVFDDVMKLSGDSEERAEKKSTR